MRKYKNNTNMNSKISKINPNIMPTLTLETDAKKRKIQIKIAQTDNTIIMELRGLFFTLKFMRVKYLTVL